MIAVGKLVAGLALAAGGVGTSVAVVHATGSTERDQGVVRRIVDGDTLDVEIGSRVERVRLLNVDTPETVDPQKPVQCLGPEATEYLTGLLPAGSPVTLEYDEERTDPRGRTLAAVFTSNGKLVNAEIARQGLGQALIVGDNDRFHPPVEQARDEAVAAGRGLFSPEVACTVPAQVRAMTTATAAVPAVDVQASAADLDGTATAAAGAGATALGLLQAFGDGRLGVAWTALPAAEQKRLMDTVAVERDKAQQAETAARTASAAARDREATAARVEEERRRAETRERAAQEERDRRAARERAAAEAEAARRAQERRADTQAAERRKQADQKPNTSTKPNTSSGGSGGPAGYTGPRCYAPGGKTWRPC